MTPAKIFFVAVKLTPKERKILHLIFMRGAEYAALDDGGRSLPPDERDYFFWIGDTTFAGKGFDHFEIEKICESLKRNLALGFFRAAEEDAPGWGFRWTKSTRERIRETLGAAGKVAALLESDQVVIPSRVYFRQQSKWHFLLLAVDQGYERIGITPKALKMLAFLARAPEMNPPRLSIPVTEMRASFGGRSADNEKSKINRMMRERQLPNLIVVESGKRWRLNPDF